MSDKSKTLEEWFFPHQARIAKRLDMQEFTRIPVLVRDAWNARDELAKEELAKMQAELDKRDDLLWFIRDHLKWRTCTNGASELILSEEKYEWLESRMRELTQGSKDDY